MEWWCVSWGQSVILSTWTGSIVEELHQNVTETVTFSARSACGKEMRGGRARGSEWITARSAFKTDPLSERVAGQTSAAAEQHQRLNFPQLVFTKVIRSVATTDQKFFCFPYQCQIYRGPRSVSDLLPDRKKKREWKNIKSASAPERRRLFMLTQKSAASAVPPKWSLWRSEKIIMVQKSSFGDIYLSNRHI